jgi:hypothetical protein
MSAVIFRNEASPLLSSRVPLSAKRPVPHDAGTRTPHHLFRLFGMGVRLFLIKFSVVRGLIGYWILDGHPWAYSWRTSRGTSAIRMRLFCKLRRGSISRLRYVLCLRTQIFLSCLPVCLIHAAMRDNGHLHLLWHRVLPLHPCEERPRPISLSDRARVYLSWCVYSTPTHHPQPTNPDHEYPFIP